MTIAAKYVDEQNSSLLAGKSLEELLLLVADEAKGCKPAAMDTVLALGFDAVYPTLERAVRDDDNADLRNGAMEILVKFREKALPKLIGLLEDPNEEVRNFSTVMLGDIGSREAVGSLVKALRDSDVNVRHGAAEALVKIGDRAALPSLLELLKEDFWLQYPAITAIGEMQDSRAIPHLLELLDNEMLTEMVITALGKIGDPRALLPLGNVLIYTDGRFVGAAAKAIVAIQKSLDDSFANQNTLAGYSQTVSLKNVISEQSVAKLKELLQATQEKETMIAVITLLGWLGEVSALPEFFRLLGENDYLDVVESAILALGKPALPSLLEAISQAQPHDNIKIVVARSLRWLGDESEIKVLRPLLASRNEEVQVEALEALNGIIDKGLLPRLFELMESGSEAILFPLLEGLGQYPYPQLAKPLERFLAAQEPTQRQRAVMLIGRLHAEVPLTLLVPLFKDAEAVVRKEAVKAVGLRQIKEAIPLLLEVLRDVDDGVREAAVMALAEFGADAPLQEVVQLLGSGSESLDFVVIRAIGKIGTGKGTAALVNYLEREGLDRQLEFAVIEALGKLGDETAANHLIGYLQHPDPDIRRLAVTSLGLLRDFDLIPAIQTVLNDPSWSVRTVAVQMLGKSRDVRGMPALLAAAVDPDFMVRKNAILALGDLGNPAAVPGLVEQLVDVELGKYAFEALLKIGKQGLPWLHRSVKKNYSLELKERLIDLIGKLGQRKSVDPLLELMDDPSPAIRLAAIDALVFCTDCVLLKKLAQLRKSDQSEEVRIRAELALSTLTMEKYI